MFPCWHPCTGYPWPLASRFVVLANPCTFCDTFACCCCGCCWGMVLVSGVCPSIPDPLPCWLGVPGTGGNPSLRLQPPFPVPRGNPSPRLQPPFPSPLSAIPGLGQPCTPWLTLPGSIPTTPLRAASRQLRYHAEGNLTFETSRPTWVSVQDVVLNTQKDRPRNQVNYSQSSATFTTQAQNNDMSLLMSLWFLLVCHALTQNDAESPVSIFLPTSQKRSKTHVVAKSLYIKTWFVCLNKFECLKNVETFQAPKHGSWCLPQICQQLRFWMPFRTLLSLSSLRDKTN